MPKLNYRSLTIQYPTALAARASLEQNTIEAQCPVTGLIFSLALPGLASLDSILDYPCPLASRETAQQCVRLGFKQHKIQEFGTELLAGLCLSIYGGFSLFDRGKLSAVEANSLLAACGPVELINLLWLSQQIKGTAHAECLPAFSLEPKEDRALSGAYKIALQSYSTLLRNCLPQSQLEKVMIESTEAGIKIKAIQSSFMKGQIALARQRQQRERLTPNEVPRRFTESTKRAESEFQEARRQLRGAIFNLVLTKTINGSLAQALRTLAKERNLLTAEKVYKDKVGAALLTLANREAIASEQSSVLRSLALIITQQYDPYLVESVSLDSVFDDFEELAPAPAKQRSIADILASKLAKTKSGI